MFTTVTKFVCTAFCSLVQDALCSAHDRWCVSSTRSTSGSRVDLVVGWEGGGGMITLHSIFCMPTTSTAGTSKFMGNTSCRQRQFGSGRFGPIKFQSFSNGRFCKA